MGRKGTVHSFHTMLWGHAVRVPYVRCAQTSYSTVPKLHSSA